MVEVETKEMTQNPIPHTLRPGEYIALILCNYFNLLLLASNWLIFGVFEKLSVQVRLCTYIYVF